MELTIYLAEITVLLAVNMLTGSYIGWVLTEWRRPVFAFKPFNCRPCLTFWATIATGLPLAAHIADEWNYRSGSVILYLLVAVVVLTAFINFLVINNKIQIYE